ncbi:helix-turn-helix transcriptional regulator [Cysteiniphilum halobium]|uniref:helix-turn-helix transcriptional regulator n=1 Tax=Cysteiniphilum halobium TaxID=2219059 RepID=UPI000E64F1CB|nr:LuxR C-terminal-related transcriptional regulator [Cysteiniphilum halobium]
MEFANQKCTLQDIHHYHWKKHEHTFNKIVQSMNLPFDIEGLTYTETFNSGVAITIPLKYLESFYDWAQSEKAYISSFLNVLNRPKVVTLEELNICSKDSYPYHLSLVTQEAFNILPIQYLKIGNQSIANLCIFIKKTNYLEVSIQYAHLNVLALTRKLFDSLRQEYHYLVRDFLVNTKQGQLCFKQHNMPKIFPDLTRSEKSFLLAICQGLYETKQVAIYLNRSVRTVEGLMRSVLDKLECKNRYELFVKIGNDYSCLSHLIAGNEKLSMC